MGRPRGTGSVDGFAIALDRDPDTPISLAVFIEAERRGRLAEFETRPSACPSCRASTRLRVRIRDRQGTSPRVGCPSCVPRTRWCVGCESSPSIDEFDITPNTKLGFKLEPLCVSCRRAINRERYHEMKDMPREVPKRVQCVVCDRVWPATDFIYDGRYTHGRYGRCRRCRA